MGISKGAVSLSNRETIKLLQQWGFEVVKGKGGHVVLIRDGKRLQVTAPGRTAQNTYRIFKKAAAMLNLSMNEFIDGPPKGTLNENRDSANPPDC